MLVYILTGLVVFLSLRNYENVSLEPLNSKKNYKKNLYKYIAIFVCVLVFGLRDYSVGTDTKNYLNIFNWLGSELVWERLIYEKGFCIVSILINKIFRSFTAFLLVFGIILYWNIISSVCELSESPSISMLCYFGLGSFAQSCNVLRQYLAMSFCLIALRYLIKKNRIVPFILFILIGFLFHTSAIIFFIVLPLKYVKFEIKTVIMFAIISLAIILCLPYLLKLFDSILGSSYYGYIRFKANPFTLTNIGTIALMGIALFCIINQRKVVKKNTKKIKEYDFFANMFLVFLALFVISIFSVELVDRIAIYFMPSIFFIIPIVLKSYKKYLSTFFVNVLFVGFLCLTLFLLVVRGSYEVLPYNFINFI